MQFSYICFDVRALLNALVHVVMYFYYFLAGLGPRYKKFLWWKQYITTFQITQFVIATIHILYYRFFLLLWTRFGSAFFTLHFMQTDLWEQIPWRI